MIHELYAKLEKLIADAKADLDKAAGGKQEPWHILGICKRHYDFGKECYKCVDPSTCKWSAGN